MAEDAPLPVAESQPAPPKARVPFAWQALTAGGVARFASVRFANLFAVEFVVALVVTATVFWFLSTVWFPRLREALQHLPEKATVRSGRLQTDAPNQVLVDGRFLGFALRGQDGPVTLTGDVRIEMGQSGVTACSLFGCYTYPYPADYIIYLTRAEAEPWWGAWQPIILGIVSLAVPMALFLCWAMLATLYAPVAWLIAFYADRKIDFAGSWRLASAALMPGALIFSAAIFAYGARTIDLVRLCICIALHIVAGWVYVVVSPYCLPRIDSAAKTNPFAPTHTEERGRQM